MLRLNVQASLVVYDTNGCGKVDLVILEGHADQKGDRIAELLRQSKRHAEQKSARQGTLAPPDFFFQMTFTNGKSDDRYATNNGEDQPNGSDGDRYATNSASQFSQRHLPAGF